MTDKPAEALALLAGQRTDLEQTIAYWSQGIDHYSQQRVREAQRELARIAVQEDEMARDPEFFAGLVLGFQGENDRAPLIRLICSDTPAAAKARRAA